jgi:hypothetical protein
MENIEYDVSCEVLKLRLLYHHQLQTIKMRLGCYLLVVVPNLHLVVHSSQVIFFWGQVSGLAYKDFSW